MNSQAKIQDEIKLHNQGKRVVSASGVMDLIGTTSNTSFT
jgi:hypothetical protein